MINAYQRWNIDGKGTSTRKSCTGNPEWGN
jgi:hypothetical protein